MDTEQIAVRTPNLLTPDNTTLFTSENMMSIEFKVGDENRAVAIIPLTKRPGYFGLEFVRKITEEVKKEIDTNGLKYNQSISSDGDYLHTHVLISSESLDALNILTSVACEKLSDKFLKSE